MSGHRRLPRHAGPRQDPIDPDLAVTALENATADLRRLTREQREALAVHADRLADRGTDPRMAEFLRGFAQGGGLLDER